MAPRILVPVATVAIVVFLTAAKVETQSGFQDVAAALLTEVRALRTTIAVVAAAGARGQLTLGRLQLQEQRVNALGARLETTREQLAMLQREAALQREECTRLEEALKNPATSFNPSHGEYTPTREEIEMRSKRSTRTLITQRAAATGDRS
jgi:hypothetical protein